jgi:hypothetical protein
MSFLVANTNVHCCFGLVSNMSFLVANTNVHCCFGLVSNMSFLVANTNVQRCYGLVSYVFLVANTNVHCCFGFGQFLCPALCDRSHQRVNVTPAFVGKMPGRTLFERNICFILEIFWDKTRVRNANT